MYWYKLDTQAIEPPHGKVLSPPRGLNVLVTDARGKALIRHSKGGPNGLI